MFCGRRLAVGGCWLVIGGWRRVARSLALGVWGLVLVCWRLLGVVGSWRCAVCGRWTMVGGWRLVVGECWLVVVLLFIVCCLSFFYLRVVCCRLSLMVASASCCVLLMARARYRVLLRFGD